MPPIYLDHNATTPIAPEVAAAMQPYLTEIFGNPSSGHWYGVEARKTVMKARQQVSELLECQPDEIVFTSGGSEANNYAIKGIALQFEKKGRHIITSQIEHPAVLNVCAYLEQEHGFEITRVSVDAAGMIQLAELEAAIRADTILITVMHANNEVGTIQPIAEISCLARAHGIVFHTDAAQSVGKIPTTVTELGVDLLSIAGHKLYAPKGIGALYVRRGLTLKTLVHGADHESGRRAGTENILEIAGLGAACELAVQKMGETAQKQQVLRDQLWDGLHAEISDIVLNGHPEKRLPNTLNITFPGIDANTLLDELTEIAASPGAACHTDVAEPSAVLTAMGIPVEMAMSTIRFSVGRLNDAAQIDRAVALISEAVKRLSPGTGVADVVESAAGEVKLTHFTHGLGCACKLRPQNLEKVLAALPRISHPNVLIGNDQSDDAAVYQLDEQTALVQTVDFFTPVVDDPYDFGAISAANSLSDIYAMGAEPLYALNIVGFPEKRLPLSVLQAILLGANDKAAEAGIPIVGGHTVEDSEPKFGLAVTGKVHPGKFWSNGGAQVGDTLILTKPLGLGILTTSLKRGLLEPETARLVVATMAELNRVAAEQARHFTIHACTDVTGFGLMGHLKEMTVASAVTARIELAQVPILPEARNLALAGVIPGGSVANQEYVAPFTNFAAVIPAVDRLLLCDAQTSGGLLFSVPTAEVAEILAALHEKNIMAAAIGQIIEKGNGQIHIV